MRVETLVFEFNCILYRGDLMSWLGPFVHYGVQWHWWYTSLLGPWEHTDWCWFISWNG